MSRKYSVLVVFIFFFAIVSCNEASQKSAQINANKLFRTHCVNCHGADGKLGDNGAKDLSLSPLTVQERIKIISNGKNQMTEFGSILKKEEIEALAKYTLKLNALK